MNYSMIRVILGWVMVLEGAFMLLPALTGLIYGEYREAVMYLILAGCVAGGGFFMRWKKPRVSTFYAREGFVAVAAAWLLLSLIGALPFRINGDIPRYIDALFEVISGCTTTGSSILANVEAMTHANLLWRSFTHWIGGMGVLVFILAVLPMTGGSTMNLMKAESPGPSVGKLVPKIRDTAVWLYGIYFVMTIIQIVLMLLGGMPVFDALCTAFGTAGTGGFGIRSDSIAGYSVYLQNVITIFMMLFGVNFTFYYFLLIRRVKDAFSMEEVRWYLLIYLGAVLLITANLTGTSGLSGVLTNFQAAAFQVASVMTTTGFATVDFDLWPGFSRTVMVMVMFIGACAGSTGGGIKVSRILLYVKQVRIELKQQIHPRSVKVLKMDGKAADKGMIHSCDVFLMAYLLIFAGSVLVLSLDGFDLTTTFTAVAATINNIGPGLGGVGPTANFAAFSDISKCVMMFDMLAGRLEIIPILVMFNVQTWKRA